MSRKQYKYSFCFTGPHMEGLMRVLEKEMENMLAFRPQLRNQCKETHKPGKYSEYVFDTWRICFGVDNMIAESEAPHIAMRKGLRLNLIKGRIIFG